MKNTIKIKDKPPKREQIAEGECYSKLDWIQENKHRLQNIEEKIILVFIVGIQ